MAVLSKDSRCLEMVHERHKDPKVLECHFFLNVKPMNNWFDHFPVLILEICVCQCRCLVALSY
jgi:hypothetical protein